MIIKLFIEILFANQTFPFIYVNDAFIWVKMLKLEDIFAGILYAVGLIL